MFIYDRISSKYLRLKKLYNCSTERVLVMMEPNYMWTCQGLKVNKEDHLKETGMEESVLKDVFIVRNKAIGSSNVRNF